MTFEDYAAQFPAKKPLYKRWWFITIAIILLLILAGAAWLLIHSKREADAINAAVEDCTQSVIDHAKYPGGAEIVNYDVELLEKANANRGVIVSGEADFPNGFGTPVRMEFSCPSIIVFGSGGHDVGSVFVNEK